MRFGITGATGLVGTALREHLALAGHEVVTLRRGDPSDDGPTWKPDEDRIEPNALDGCDVVVHLAGASIGEGRWSKKRKRLLRSSRIEATRLLVEHLAALPQPPKALLCASAVGYYGDRGDDIVDERSEAGAGFLSELVRDWEHEARAAEEHGIRAVQMRFGVVLSKEGGALPRMLTPFRMGVGGRLGNGRQWMSWIAVPDAVRAIEWLATSEISGPVNVTAPEPVKNSELTRALGRALHRPALFPMPGFMLRMVVGEAANELLLASNRVAPRALVAAGFTFEHPAIEVGLATALASGSEMAMAAAEG